jgi:hypothetical protein
MNPRAQEGFETNGHRLRTVELLIWNTIGTGPEAIPYDGYSTADEINKKIILFCSV